MKCVSLNFFCFMNHLKKSVAGRVEVWRLSDGVNGWKDSASGVKIVAFSLLETTANNGSKTDLSGSENGYLSDKLSRL